MIRTCLFAFAVLFTCSLAAQDYKYPVSAISAAMKKNCSTVKREERIEFEVRSKEKATYRDHSVTTVFSEAGRKALFFYEFTDKFRSLGDVAIELFDAQGKSLRKYSRSDMVSQSAGEGLVYDGKVYYIDVPVNQYPVTISIDYEMKYNGILNYPDYLFQYPGQSVEQSSYTIKLPADQDIFYKARNTNLPPQKAEDGKYRTYTWSVKDLVAIRDEEGAVSRESRFPGILITPSAFSIDGYEGELSSWKNFGYWYTTLLKDVVNLPDERKDFFRTLVKDAASDRDKAAIIYRYLQQNCRYVLITLGIGGFKPFAASFVDKKKYGDCKALSNYTLACLEAVGVKSYLALVNAEYNKEPVDPAFPHNSFNHVILCVPQQKDSIWLECTSTTNEFGILGPFTENRNALLITEDGGKLVPTPRSKSTENQLNSRTQISLLEDGSGSADVLMQMTGEYRQDMIHYIKDEKKDDQKIFLVSRLGFIQPDEFSLGLKDQGDQKNLTAKMTFEKIPDFTAGSKMFLHPRIHKLWATPLPTAENRTQDFFFQTPFIKTDTTVYLLPAGYGPESLPKPKNLNFEFGSYTSDIRFDEQKKQIITTARLELTRNRIPVASYESAKKFFDSVLADYTEKVVVKRL